RSLWVVLLLLLIGTQIVAAQETAQVSPALLAHMEGIEQTTSSIRGLAPLQEIERGFPTREDIAEYVRELISEDLSPEEIERATVFYAAFDLLPRDIDLRTLYIDLLTSQ